MNFYATKHSARLEVKLTTYEQIRIVFTRRRHRHGVYRFFLPTAGDEGDHDYSSSGSTVTHSIAEQAPQDDCWHDAQAC
jgi:hypothetical protein